MDVVGEQIESSLCRLIPTSTSLVTLYSERYLSRCLKTHTTPCNERYRHRSRPPPRYALHIFESAARPGTKAKNSCGHGTRCAQIILLRSLPFTCIYFSSRRPSPPWRRTWRTWKRVSSELILQFGTQRELTQLRIVEETGPRMFGLEESDVMERRGYVDHVKREIEVRLAGCFV